MLKENQKVERKKKKRLKTENKMVPVMFLL